MKLEVHAIADLIWNRRI